MIRVIFSDKSTEIVVDEVELMRLIKLGTVAAYHQMGEWIPAPDTLTSETVSSGNLLRYSASEDL